MKGKRQVWLDWPMNRLADYAEAHREDVELLSDIRDEAMRRQTPAGEELATRVDGLLAALGVFPDDEAAASPDLALRLEAMARELRDVRDRLATTERRMREAELRASEAERRAEALAVATEHHHNTVHERVHLAPSAPEWLVEAAQRAFRMRYHPDRYADPDKKSKAEAVFKEAEQVFSRLRTADELARQN
jgi:hypothetical protein